MSDFRCGASPRAIHKLYRASGKAALLWFKSVPVLIDKNNITAFSRRLTFGLDENLDMRPFCASEVGVLVGEVDDTVQ